MRIVELNLPRDQFRNLVGTMDAMDSDWRFYSGCGLTWPTAVRQKRILEANLGFVDQCVAEDRGHLTSRVTVRVNDQTAMVLRLSYLDAQVYPVPDDAHMDCEENA